MVSFAQRLVNLRARWMEKPLLAGLIHQPSLRVVSGIYARVAYKTHSDMRFTPGHLGSVPVVWCDQGIPHFEGVILYLHGGAYTVGGAASHRHLAARLAGVTGLRSVLVDYRLAPEHPFPAGPDDVLSAYQTLLKQGYRGDQIVLAGDSAGGGLAYGLMSRILQQDLPKPRCIVAISPLVDLTFSGASFQDNQRAEMMLPHSWLKRTRQLYLKDTPANDSLATPLFAELTGTSPSMILVGSGEILRDDSRRLAAKLRDSGAEVTLIEQDDVPHIWPTHLGRSPEADAAINEIASFIRRGFNQHLSGEQHACK